MVEDHNTFQVKTATNSKYLAKNPATFMNPKNIYLVVYVNSAN